MKKSPLTLRITAFIAVLTILASCAKQELPLQDKVRRPVAGGMVSMPCSDSYTLYAGQNINAGTINVSNTGTQVIVTYNTTGGWELEETHLYIGTAEDVQPSTGNGSPIPGQFPYKEAHSGITSYTWVLPRPIEPCFIVAAHASVVKTDANGSTQQETAWSEGESFLQQGNWATYSEYCSVDCILNKVP